MKWQDTGLVFLRHLIQFNRLLKNFVSALKQSDQLMSSKAENYFLVNLESVDWDKCKPNDKVQKCT